MHMGIILSMLDFWNNTYEVYSFNAWESWNVSLGYVSDYRGDGQRERDRRE